MEIALHFSPEDTRSIEAYARVHSISVSETLRRAFMQMVEDEADMEYCIRSIESHEGADKRYALDEVDAESDRS